VGAEQQRHLLLRCLYRNERALCAYTAANYFLCDALEVQAWIFNGTVRENILCGQEYDECRYATALRVCALPTDLAALPGGDATEIGGRGTNLSGGQKARIQV
jgi:ABC-type transport system involved in cytochrome bd biosynthesis fused ATPase/permease subunit